MRKEKNNNKQGNKGNKISKSHVYHTEGPYEYGSKASGLHQFQRAEFSSCLHHCTYIYFLRICTLTDIVIIYIYIYSIDDLLQERVIIWRRKIHNLQSAKHLVRVGYRHNRIISVHAVKAYREVKVQLHSFLSSSSRPSVTSQPLIDLFRPPLIVSLRSAKLSSSIWSIIQNYFWYPVGCVE